VIVNSEPLVLPRGVRLARRDEIPGSVAERWPTEWPTPEAHALVPGYVLHQSNNPAFRAYLEANVHAPRLWATFVALAEQLLPYWAAPIIGIKEEEPVFGPYGDKSDALALFTSHAEMLSHDGFLEFGLISSAEGRTDELFVAPAKYLKIWTNQPEQAGEVLEAHGVPRRSELRFLDEFPCVTEPLRNQVAHHDFEAVHRAIIEGFASIREVPYPSAGA
jgi:hypothetical protein